MPIAGSDPGFAKRGGPSVEIEGKLTDMAPK